MIFENPGWWLLVLIIPLAGLAFWGWKVKKQILKIFQLNPDLAQRAQIKKYLVAGIILVLIVLALTFSPVSISEKSSPNTGQIILLVDVSKSMAAKKDLDSLCRLERAKMIINQIIDRFPEAEISLHGFTSLARSHTPFTKDHLYLRRSVDRVLDINSVLGEGTSFGLPILGVIDKFAKDEKAKIIVLFSDGEFFSNLGYSKDPILESALIEAKKNRVKIITVGIGELEGATIPLYDKEGKFIGKAKLKGEIYITYLKPEILKEIAIRTGGKYFFETERNELISYIGENLVVGETSKKEHFDLYFLFLLALAVFWGIFSRYYLL